MSVLLRNSASIALVATVGCGPSVEDTPSDASSGATDAATTSTSTAADSDGADTTRASSSSSDASSSTGTPMGPPCGEEICALDEFCNWGKDSCGREPLPHGELPFCDVIPQTCDVALFPICACDGQTYDNGCEAAALGIDADANGSCAPPEGTFACGHRFCPIGTVCFMGVSDLIGGEDYYACEPMPDACLPEPDCDCLLEAQSWCSIPNCSVLPGGDLRIDC